MTERWLAIPGLDGYEVSDQGNVRGLTRTIDVGHGKRLLRGRVLKGSSNAKGYKRVYVGSRRERLVHRLVLEAFVGPCPDGMEGCHNNGKAYDNRLENLRWDTRSSNNLDKNIHGTNYQVNKTHCKHGHEFNSANTITNAAGYRQCRACNRNWNREKQPTPEERAAKNARVRDWRRRTGQVTGLHNYGSRTHCNKGHEFTPENTLIRSDGGRRCRTCWAAGRAESNKRMLAKRKADPAKRAAWNAYMREYKRKRAQAN